MPRVPTLQRFELREQRAEAAIRRGRLQVTLCFVEATLGEPETPAVGVPPALAPPSPEKVAGSLCGARRSLEKWADGIRSATVSGFERLSAGFLATRR
ncbi:hypothetical protein BH23GEM7_BH23GEM7_11770 [soil metagenome]|nr:hypothetical protein [Gemmatimonadota bacterium]